MTTKGNRPHYEFSEKYSSEHAQKYFEKHNTGLFRRLSNWRETGMARQALTIAGRPRSVLDLPSGTGRFWELLAEEPGRRIYAADNSQNMLDVGMNLRPKAVTTRIEKAFQTSAFAIDLPDNFVDCVFCIRLLHHIHKSEDRILMLKEFARVSADTVIVSLWVDGNFRAWRHRRKLEKSGKQSKNRFLTTQTQIEADFAAAGLEIIDHVDFIKYWEKWRSYVLKVRKAS